MQTLTIATNAISSMSVYFNGTAPTDSAAVASTFAKYFGVPLLATPTNGTLTATSGGTLAATTYYVRTTLTSASGESLPATETSLAVAASNVLNVASPASTAGATGWNAYVSTATGTETKQNSSPIAIGTAFVEPTTGLVAGSALPTVNTASYFLTPVAATSTVATTLCSGVTTSAGATAFTAAANTANAYSGYVTQQLRTTSAAAGGNGIFASPDTTLQYVWS
ncbi:MAG: hypothetical protein NVSMB19_18530 [Vulcanimicrobiaceae bacterium]